jgi:hypothetical protein
MKTLVSTTMRGGMNFDSACDGRLQTEKFAGQRLEPRATSDARQTDFLIIYPSLYNAPLLVCSASACESQIACD